MGAVADAVTDLVEGLGEVEDLRVETDPAQPPTPPVAYIGPPALVWEGTCPDPTTAKFVVYVVVGATDRALEVLWDLVPRVAAAIEGVRDAVVIRATPGSWSIGGADLPAYLIEVDYSL